MGAFVDRTGQRFGKWTALSYLGSSRWNCMCDCGVSAIIPTGNLTLGKSTSCGCAAGAKISAARYRHGTPPEHAIWSGIKTRCYNKNRKAYKDYGGRGITVCERWLHSFENFYADMGPRPGKGWSVDRKDNAKGYSPDNCVWATARDQAINRKRTIWVSVNGQRLCLKDACAAINIPLHVVQHRRQRGIPIVFALWG